MSLYAMKMNCNLWKFRQLQPRFLKVATLGDKIIGRSANREPLNYMIPVIRVPSSHFNILSLASTQFWNIPKPY